MYTMDTVDLHRCHIQNVRPFTIQSYPAILHWSPLLPPFAFFCANFDPFITGIRVLHYIPL